MNDDQHRMRISICATSLLGHDLARGGEPLSDVPSGAIDDAVSLAIRIQNATDKALGNRASMPSQSDMTEAFRVVRRWLEQADAPMRIGVMNKLVEGYCRTCGLGRVGSPCSACGTP